MNNKKAIGGGVLAAGAAAAGLAAGYYFYASKDAKKNRQIAAKWAGDMKKDVVKRGKALKHIDRAAIGAIVEQSARAYKGVRDLDRGEIERAASELKKHWEKIAGELKKGSATAKTTAKRVSKRAKGAMKEAKGVMKKAKKLARRATA